MRTCIEAGERRSGQLDGKTTRFWLRASLSGNEVDGFGSWIIEICTGGALATKASTSSSLQQKAEKISALEPEDDQAIEKPHSET